MTETAKLGPWVRRFLLEHLVGERNLARNTQRSYRDTLALLIPFIAGKTHNEVDELDVDVEEVAPPRLRERSNARTPSSTTRESICKPFRNSLPFTTLITFRVAHLPPPTNGKLR